MAFKKISSTYFSRLLGLAGDYSVTETKPEHCPHCQCKEFYKQSDFRRSLGLILVGIASLMTVVLMVMGYNWFVTWSPMFAFLLLDRLLFATRPLILICYRCRHILRGLPQADADSFEAFDLEIYDRYKYKEQNAESL